MRRHIERERGEVLKPGTCASKGCTVYMTGTHVNGVHVTTWMHNYYGIYAQEESSSTELDQNANQIMMI